MEESVTEIDDGTYKKSKITTYLEAVQDLLQDENITNQYKMSATVLDALYGTSNENKFSTNIDEAKAQLMEFNCQDLFQYFSLFAQEIDYRYVTYGDVLVVLDDLHNDVAFCTGNKFVYLHDESQTTAIATLFLNELPDNTKAFRLTL